MTTTPDMETVSSMKRMPSTAAWSAAILSPRPIQRPAAIAADSVTRTSSSARLRSGAVPRGASVTGQSYCGRLGRLEEHDGEPAEDDQSPADQHLPGQRLVEDRPREQRARHDLEIGDDAHRLSGHLADQ